MDDNYKLAVKNIAQYGDTDIFPFPIENAIFFDKPDKVLRLLKVVGEEFEKQLDLTPPVNLASLAPAGYAGFRWATQLDPMWNAYFLSLVLSYAPRIEAARISTTEEAVFSYRYRPNKDDGSLFDKEITWFQFKKQSIALASKYEFVLVCDIADFYARIYHHRVDNALRYLDDGSHDFKKIMVLLQQYAQNVSYGLPVGGPASRILAELLLNSTDRLFRAAGLVFTRFVDDYHFFAGSKEEAHAALVTVSEMLYANEGLSLQKGKTRVMSSAEFKSSAALMKDDADEPKRASLLKLSLKFDPYSANPKEDYEALSKAVGELDTLGMLAAELNKTRVHGPLTRKLIASIQFLDQKQKNDAISTLILNFEVLSPLFGLVAITIKSVFEALSKETQQEVHKAICELVRGPSHIVQVELNMAYAIRVLGLHHSDEAEGLLARLYDSTRSLLIRKEVILAMARWRAVHWLSDKKRFFQTMTAWEKRAFLIASYCLGDAGRHWRDHAKDTFDAFTTVVHEWASERAEALRDGRLPI